MKKSLLNKITALIDLSAAAMLTLICIALVQNNTGLSQLILAGMGSYWLLETLRQLRELLRPLGRTKQ